MSRDMTWKLLREPETPKFTPSPIAVVIKPIGGPGFTSSSKGLPDIVWPDVFTDTWYSPALLARYLTSYTQKSPSFFSCTNPRKRAATPDLPWNSTLNVSPQFLLFSPNTFFGCILNELSTPAIASDIPSPSA